MKAKQIAIFTDNFPPYGGGGIAQCALGLATQLGIRKYKVTVFTHIKKEISLDIYHNTLFEIKIMRGLDWNKYRKWYSLYYGWKFLNQNYNPIFIASTWQFADGISMLKNKYKFKLLTFTHSRDIAKVNKKVQKQALKNAFIKSDFVFAVSNFIKRMVSEKINDEVNIQVLNNGVDSSKFCPKKVSKEFYEKNNIDPTKKLILSVGRIISLKQYETIIEALKIVIETLHRYPFNYAIIGSTTQDENYADKLSSITQKLNLSSNVRFPGLKLNDDLIKWYRAADLFIQASGRDPQTNQEEGFPITVLEAQSCGLPVIVTNSGGMPETIINGKTGIVVPMNNPKILAEKMTSFLKNIKKWQNFGKNGRENVVNNFRWKVITDKLLNIIGEKDAEFNGQCNNSSL